MNYKIERAFEKDFGALKDKSLAKVILTVIEDIVQAQTIAGISNIKKMKGYKSAYRIRCGDYRVGVLIVQGTVILVAFAHRKDIYKVFP
jgi:mRNA interferase RelE/StbE